MSSSSGTSLVPTAASVVYEGSSFVKGDEETSVVVHYSAPHQRPHYQLATSSSITSTHRFQDVPVSSATALTITHNTALFGTRDGLIAAAPLSLAPLSDNLPVSSVAGHRLLSSSPIIASQRLSDLWRVGSPTKEEHPATNDDPPTAPAKKRVMIAPKSNYEPRTVRALAVSPGSHPILAALTDTSEVFLFRLQEASDDQSPEITPLQFSAASHRVKHLQGNIPPVAVVSLAPFGATGTVSEEEFLEDGSLLYSPFNPTMKWIAPTVLLVGCEGGAVVAATVLLGGDAPSSTFVEDIRCSLLCRDIESADLDALMDEYAADEEADIQVQDVAPPVLQIEYAPLLDGGKATEMGVLTLTTESRTALLRGLCPASLMLPNGSGKDVPSCYFSLLHANLCDVSSRTPRSKVASILQSLQIRPLFALLDKEDDDDDASVAAANSEGLPVLMRIPPGVVQVGNKARQPGDFGGSFVSPFPYLVSHHGYEAAGVGLPALLSAAQYSLVDTLMQWDALYGQSDRVQPQQAPTTESSSSDWPVPKPSLPLVKLYTSRHNERLFGADSVTGKVIKTFHYFLKDGDPSDTETPLGLLTGIPRVLTFNAVECLHMAQASASIVGRRNSSASSSRSSATTTRTAMSTLTSASLGFKQQSAEMQHLLNAAMVQGGLTDAVISSVWGKGAVGKLVSSRHSEKSRGSSGKSNTNTITNDEWDNSANDVSNTSLQNILEKDYVTLWSQSRTFAALLTISSEHGCSSAWQFHWGDADGGPGNFFIGNVNLFRYNAAALVLCSNNTILTLPTAPSLPPESFCPKHLTPVSFNQLVAAASNADETKGSVQTTAADEGKEDGDDAVPDDEEANDGAEKKKKKVKKVVKRVIIKKKKDGTVVSSVAAPIAVDEAQLQATPSKSNEQQQTSPTYQPQWGDTPPAPSSIQKVKKTRSVGNDLPPPVVAFEDSLNAVANPKKRPAAKPISIMDGSGAPAGLIAAVQLDGSSPPQQDDASPRTVFSYTPNQSDPVKRALAEAAAVMARATENVEVDIVSASPRAHQDPEWLAAATKVSTAAPALAEKQTNDDVAVQRINDNDNGAVADELDGSSHHSDKSDLFVGAKGLDDLEPNGNDFIIVDESSYKEDPVEATLGDTLLQSANLPPRPATASMFLSGTVDRVHALWEATSLEYTSHPTILQGIVCELLPAVEQVLYLAQVGTGILRQVSAIQSKNRLLAEDESTSSLNASLRAPVDLDATLDKIILPPMGDASGPGNSLRSTMISPSAQQAPSSGGWGNTRASVRPEMAGGTSTPTPPKAPVGLLTGTDREGIIAVLTTPGLLDQLLRNIKLGMLFPDSISEHRFNASYLMLTKLLTLVDAVLIIAPASALRPSSGSSSGLASHFADRSVSETAEELCATLCSVFTESKHSSPFGRLMAQFQATRGEVLQAHCAADLDGYGRGNVDDDPTPSQPGHFFDTLSLKEATQSTFLLMTGMQWALTVRMLKPPRGFRVGTAGAVAGIPGHFLEERPAKRGGASLRQSVLSPTTGVASSHGVPTFQPPVSLDVAAWIYCGSAWGQQTTAPPRRNEVITWLQASIGPLLLLGSQGAAVLPLSEVKPGSPADSLLRPLGTIASVVSEAVCCFNEDRVNVLSQIFSSRPLLVARCFVAVRGYATVHCCNEEVSETVRTVFPAIQRSTLSTARVRATHEISDDLDTVMVHTTKQLVLKMLDEVNGVPNPMMQLPTVFAENTRDSFLLDLMSIETEALRTISRHLAAEAIMARSCTVGEIDDNGLETNRGHRGAPGVQTSPHSMARRTYMMSRRISASREASPSMSSAAAARHNSLGNGSFAFGSLASELTATFTFDEWLQEWQKQLDVCWEGVVLPMVASIIFFGSVAANRPASTSPTAAQEAPTLTQHSQALMCAMYKISQIKRHNPYKRVSHFPALDTTFSFEKWSEAMLVQQKRLEKIEASKTGGKQSNSSPLSNPGALVRSITTSPGFSSPLRSALLLVTSRPSPAIGNRLLQRDPTVLDLLTSGTLDAQDSEEDDEENVAEMSRMRAVTAMNILHFLPYLAVVFPSKLVSVVLDSFPQVVPLKHLVNALTPEAHNAAASVLNFWVRQGMSEDLFEPLNLTDLREVVCVSVLGVAEQRAAAVYLNPSHRGWGGWRLGDDKQQDSKRRAKTLEQAQEESVYPNCWFPTAAALWSPVDVIEVVLVCRQQLYQAIAETEAAAAATNSAVKASQNIMKQSGGHNEAMKEQRQLARHTPQQILSLLSRKLAGLEASIMVFLKQYNVVHANLRNNREEDDSFFFVRSGDGGSDAPQGGDSFTFSPGSPVTNNPSDLSTPSMAFDENICCYSNRLPSNNFVVPRSWSPRRVEELLGYFPEFLSLFDQYCFPRAVVDLDIIPLAIDRHLRLRTVHSLLPLLQYRPDNSPQRGGGGPSGGAYHDRTDAGLSASGLGSTRSSAHSGASGVQSPRQAKGIPGSSSDPSPSPAISEVNWLNLLRKAHRLGCLEDAAYLTLTVHIQQPKRVRYLLRRAFPLLDVDEQIDPVLRRVRDKLAAIMS